VSRRVYQTLCRKAANALAAGYSVIVDAVSLKPGERQSFLTVAEAAGVPFAGIWLEAPPATMDRRLRARRHDASDASTEVLAQQLQQDLGTVEWVRIEADGNLEGCMSAARRTLGLS
jgi:predicted kinase